MIRIFAPSVFWFLILLIILLGSRRVVVKTAKARAVEEAVPATKYLIFLSFYFFLMYWFTPACCRSPSRRVLKAAAVLSPTAAQSTTKTYRLVYLLACESTGVDTCLLVPLPEILWKPRALLLLQILSHSQKRKRFCPTLPTKKFQTWLSMFYILYLASQWRVGYVLVTRVFSEIMQMKGNGKEKASGLSVVSDDGYVYELLPFLIYWLLLLYSNPFTVEEWSDSGVGEPQLTAGSVVNPDDVIKPSAAPETATIVCSDAADESDSHSYVKFLSWHFLDYHCWIFSVQGDDSDDSLNVMLPSCQDSLLAATYKNLPKIPWV